MLPPLLLLLSLASLSAAFPSGFRDWEDRTSLHPFSAHNFVDDYLQHSGYNSPSDDELGDLIWGLLYTDSDPGAGLTSFKRSSWRHTGFPKPQPWFPMGLYGGVDKAAASRQQGAGWPAFGKREDGDHAAKKRQQAWYATYGKRSRGAEGDLPFNKRQQAWYATYG